MTDIVLYRQGDELPQYIKNNTANMAYQFFLHGGNYYLANFSAELALLEVDQHLAMCSISDKEYNDSYFSSIYSLYFNIGYEELKKRVNPFWRPLLSVLFTIVSLLAKWLKLNKCIIVNNQLTGSIIHPDWLTDNVAGITSYLQKKFPKHAILFPRFSMELNAKLYQNLLLAKYHFLAIGPSYIFDLNKINYQKSHATLNDKRLKRKTAYEMRSFTELTNENWERMPYLYDALYIKKHSRFNPHFSSRFWQDVRKDRWLDVIGIVNKQNELHAFLAFTQIGQFFLLSPAAYDTQIPQTAGLNRLIFASAIQYAEAHHLIFHYGRSNNYFKKTRGGFAISEGNMVKYDHLPFPQKIIWYLLDYATRQFIEKTIYDFIKKN